MTPPRHAGDRPSLRTFFSVLAATGTLSALVVCAAVAAAPDSARTPPAWGTGTAAAVLSAAVATAAHGLRTARGLRHRLDSVPRDLGRLLHQQARTSDETRQEQQRLIDELARQRAEFTGAFEAERARLERTSGRERGTAGGRSARRRRTAGRRPGVGGHPARRGQGAAQTRNRRISFGHGPHVCPGAALSRLEAGVALPALYARFLRLEPAVAAADLRNKPVVTQNDLFELPVRLDS